MPPFQGDPGAGMGTGLRTRHGAARGTPVPTLMGGDPLCAPPGAS